MSTLSDLINNDDDAPPQQLQPSSQPPPLSQHQFSSQYFQPHSSSQPSFFPQQMSGPSSQFLPPQQPIHQQFPQQPYFPHQQQELIEIDNNGDTNRSPHSPVLPPPKPRTQLDIALHGENGDDTLPATSLMICVDRLYQSFNNLILDFFPEPGLAVPQQNDVKEFAEFNGKTFRDACQELTAEFTRNAVEWQLSNPQEYYAEEAKDLEKAIGRQAIIQRRVEEKIDAEINKHNSDKNRRV